MSSGIISREGVDGSTVYTLAVQHFGSNEVAGFFLNLAEAKNHGESIYPQNNWDITDSYGRVMYNHDPLAAIAADAALEVARFEETARWRRHFEERAERERERERLDLAQRIARLQGFHFVEERPEESAWQKVNWLKEGF